MDWDKYISAIFGPAVPLGGSGGPRGVLGGLATTKLPFSLGEQFQLSNVMQWVITTCNTTSAASSKLSAEQ